MPSLLRRQHTSIEEVRTAYLGHLRELKQRRPWTCPRTAYRIAELAAGRPVVVKGWELIRWAPGLEAQQWVRIDCDDLAPVEPVRSPDGLTITGWQVIR